MVERNVDDFYDDPKGIKKWLGLGLMGIGGGLTGRDNVGNYMNARQAKAELAFKKWQEVQKKDPLEVLDSMAPYIAMSGNENIINKFLEYRRQVEGGVTTPIANPENSSNLSQKEKVLKDAGIPEEEWVDYNMKPTITRTRGIPTTTLVPEKKKLLGDATIKELGGLEATANDLLKNVNTLFTLNKSGKHSGAGYASTNMPGADLYAQYVQGADFASWKSDVGRAFQKYRKWATGVAAGYPELNMIAPNFPKSTDKDDVFIKKTISSIDDLQRNQETLAEYFDKAGYATSSIKRKIADIPEYASEKDVDATKMKKGQLVRVGGKLAIWD